MTGFGTLRIDEPGHDPFVGRDSRGRRPQVRQTRRLPVVIADLDDARYLVSMLGDNTNWVRNVRAADHRAVLVRDGRTAIRLEEIPVEHRATIIQRYSQVATSGRVRIPVDPDAPVSAFESVASQYPVFRIDPNSELSTRAHLSRVPRCQAPCQFAAFTTTADYTITSRPMSGSLRVMRLPGRGCR